MDPPNEFVWGDDERVIDVGVQRLVLQLMAVDGQIAAMLDQLEAAGILDEAVVVVTADHGAVFQPHKHLRSFRPGVDDDSKHDVLPVPLFVKYPGQRSAEVDGRAARNIDIVPTIADVLDLHPEGWRFDGLSLLAEPRAQRPQLVLEDAKEPVRVRGPIDAMVLARRVRAALGESGGPHDGFRFGPYGALVGQPVASFVRESPRGTVAVDNHVAFDDVRPDGLIPAAFAASVQGVDAGEWLAVAVNGTIAGIGPTHRVDEAIRVVAMLDPALITEGKNLIDVYQIEEAGTSLRRLDPPA
jgi:hypothetical protein